MILQGCSVVGFRFSSLSDFCRHTMARQGLGFRDIYGEEEEEGQFKWNLRL